MKIATTKKHKTLQTTSLTFAKKQECFAFLKEKITPDQKIMVAISGGADSMLTACVLYDFYRQEKYPLDNISFIHCNHSTRSSNADDELLIKNFFVGTNTIIVTRPSNKKASEAELRNWRYGEFKTHTKQQNIAYLIFGHNLTDRIESTFLNLLRGANLNGFLAMNSEETHHLLGDTKVLRPLL
ncbi:MAG: tRNA lysidine(34) synthetase TilS [bacterium]